MNHVVLIGRVSSEIRFLYTQKGQAVASFGLAVRRVPGHGQTTADFVQVVSFGKVAEVADKFLKKGRLIAVKGHLNTRYYERDGQRRKVIDIVAEHMRFLDAPTSEKSESTASTT